MPKDPTPTGSLTLPKFGRYRVLSKLGQGGMGAVYLACDDKLDRQVAIKVLPPESVHDPAAVARFEREAKALAKLAHPGIIQAFDSESADGRHFLVMEYVEGHSVADVLKDKGRLSPGRAADYVHQAALALQHAHEKGLIHRDIKPSNLLLSSQGQIKLLDLGLARFLQDQIVDASRTREGVGMGTPDYSAPEQFRDAHSADARSDIYALGCTLYHLLSGQVPFPGSSLSEKYKAHCQQEPTPLEELCPDAPAGLVLAVQRMMAKWPAKRFQTAQEVADVLSTHVAGSSASFTNLKSTATWHQGQLTVTDLRPRRRRLLWTGATVLLAALLVGLGYGLSRTLRPTPTNEGQQARQGDETDPNGPGKKPDVSSDLPDKKEVQADEPHNSNVLTVAKTGKANYQTISEALKNVKRGQTIRVLDSAEYVESLFLANPSQMADITLESSRRATLLPKLKNARGNGVAIDIGNVPGVTVRGFRLRSQEPAVFIIVENRSPGTVLEDLDVGAEFDGRSVGISVERATLEPGEAPIVIQNCQVQGGAVSVVLIGASGLETRRVIVRQNHFKAAQKGLEFEGFAQDALVAANRFTGMQLAGISVHLSSDDSRNLLLANNTFFDCERSIAVFAEMIQGKAIGIRNNLVLGARPLDLVHYKPPYDSFTPGDGEQVAKSWKVADNWREVREPALGTGLRKAWIPPTNDVRRDHIDGIEREIRSPDFLRPAADSPLATQGAGVTDPTLPRYVGALPPKGMPAWDWERTWHAPPPGKLITVSKDPNDKADFDTIGAALEKATPWTTIRVVDDATYGEVLSFDDKARHEGIWLDAPKRATIRLGLETRSALSIRDVRYVRVTGFRFTDVVNQRDAMRRFVTVTGRSAGSVLADLNFEPESMAIGIVLEEVDAGPGEAPMRVERCRFEPQGLQMNDGIVVTDRPTRKTCRGICLRDNRLTRCQRGIQLKGKLTDVQVTGNLVWKCTAACFQIEDLDPASLRLLVANNTAFSGDGLRIWDNEPFLAHELRQVEVVNNVIFAGENVDVGILKASTGTAPVAGDGVGLVRKWRFHGNHRDFSGTNSDSCLPLAPDDVRLNRSELAASDGKTPDRVCPRPGTALATRGAGRTDPSFPLYAGALPPDGVEPWDWERTWRARSPK